MENITGLKILLNGTSNENKDKRGSISAPPLCAVTFLLSIILILNKKMKFCWIWQHWKEWRKEIEQFYLLFPWRDSGFDGFARQYDFAPAVASENRHGPDQSGVAHIHSGTALAARNVRRLFRPSGHFRVHRRPRRAARPHGPGLFNLIDICSHVPGRRLKLAGSDDRFKSG